MGLFRVWFGTDVVLFPGDAAPGAQLERVFVCMHLDEIKRPQDVAWKIFL